MSQIIPDTDNVEVAKIAAALHIANVARSPSEPAQLPFQRWVERFNEAYSAVSAAVDATSSSAQSAPE